MTDSPRLEEVFAAVLAEHAFMCHIRQNEVTWACAKCEGWHTVGTREVGLLEHRAHVAERLAARFERVGFMLENGTNVYVRSDPPTQLANVPVFRLVGGDQ